MKGKDWDKYQKMRKIASKGSINIGSIIYAAIGIGVIVFILFIMVQSANISVSVNHSLNYASGQLNASIYPLKFNVYKTNPTNMNNLILTLKNNPKAQAEFALTYALASADNSIINSLMSTALLALIAILVFFIWLPDSGDFELPRRFNTVQTYLKTRQKAEANLKKYGYTQEEIEWYYNVQSELIKLQLGLVYRG